MTPNERYKKLKQHLKEENPILLDVIDEYENLDKLAHSLGLLSSDESYTANISWWPLISILGTFSAGKSTFINEYLMQKVQQSGNQAVDDKFTVICYSSNDKVTTLPGLALDADPRFPFYNISEEVEKVEQGEGSRVNLYLQLKTIKSDTIKGKILIDSPGFDADSQRDSILRITSHIIDMSDLVLIFFDARHPEPGAMRDTLEHLVEKTVSHRDRDKILYVLNQIDTTAKEDNLEDVIGAWQRALSQKGLISGNLFAIYSQKAMNPIDEPSVAKRLKHKKDEDLNRILERIEGVKIERAYRITKALEDFAKEIIDDKLPKLHKSLSRWSKRVIITNVFLSLIFIGATGALFVTGVLSASVEIVSGASAAIVILLIFLHFKIRKFYANLEIKHWREKDNNIAKAIGHNTKWFKSILRVWSKNWSLCMVERLKSVVDYSKAAIRRLNDQFVSPTGNPKEA